MSNLTPPEFVVLKMTRLGLIPILFALLLNACSADTRPPDVLSREQYTALLIEVYLTEAKLSQLPVTSDSTMRLYLAHEPELLKKYGLTDSTLNKTYEYYISHPNELEKVYAAVVDTLSLREQKASTSQP
jgi:hypothetical protein